MTAPTARRPQAPTRLSGAHKAVARMVGLTLSRLASDRMRELFPSIDWTLSDYRSIEGLAVVIRAKLTPRERRAFASATMMALDAEEAQVIAESLFEPDEPAGRPDPYDGDDPVEDAKWWAGCASEFELRAYAMACLARIPEPEREAIVAALKGRLVA